MNEEKISEICGKEKQVLNIKNWLITLFFLAAIIVALIIIKSLFTTNLDHGQEAVTNIIITLSIFAISIIAGYLYGQRLSKKMDKLWEQKKEFF